MNLTKATHGLAALTDSLTRTFMGKPWELPDVEMLSDPPKDLEKLILNYEMPVKPTDIERVFASYKCHVTFVDSRIGPSTTTYEINLGSGVKLSTLDRVKQDIARELGINSIRFIELRNSSNIGMEVPNVDRYIKYFKELARDIPTDYTLPFILGEDMHGEFKYSDLAKMPHLLVAGQTGSGKSVFINALICSILCRKTPQEVKFMMIDPKQVEFADYDQIPHLLEPIANETEDAKRLLDIAVEEMEHRFDLLKRNRVKKITDYNRDAFEKLPHIVFIVDEFSDLMLMGTAQERKEVENKIVRIAQKARAVGIHMVLATQKPLAKIMTSLIKANMPARISFSVASWVDSKVILDEKGAEFLLGKGDMLFKDPTAIDDFDRVLHIQAPWVPDEDIYHIAGRE